MLKKYNNKHCLLFLSWLSPLVLISLTFIVWLISKFELLVFIGLHISYLGAIVTSLGLGYSIYHLILCRKDKDMMEKKFIIVMIGLLFINIPIGIIITIIAARILYAMSVQ